MAVSYPKSTAPQRAPGVAVVTYSGSPAPAAPAPAAPAVPELLAPDAEDRIGESASTSADVVTSATSSSSSAAEFLPNAMPSPPAPAAAPSPEETSFADKVIALRNRLMTTISAERVTSEIAATALMATAFELTDLAVPDAELRPRLHALIRGYKLTGNEER